VTDTVADRYDVAVVGASVAGCTAATLLARQGLEVALIERRRDPAAYKTVCTHLIQASAVPTLARLGVLDQLYEAGAQRTRPEAWTPWGWIRPPDETSVGSLHDLNVRRQTLDPILRELAGSTDGVHLRLGESVADVTREGREVTGLVTKDRNGQRRTVQARLVVGADGRESRMGELAGRTLRLTPHRRSSFWAYFRGVGLPGRAGRFRIWFLDPEFAAAFPTDGDLTLVACMVPRERAPEFKRDIESNFMRMIGSLPDGPSMENAELASKFMGKLDMPNTWRAAARGNLALVGDAALASDPIMAVGCGWALQSAEWLADATGSVVRDPAALRHALARYRAQHRRRLGPYHLANCSYSMGRRFSPVERLMLSAAVHDPQMAAQFEAFGARRIKFGEYASPRALAGACAVHLRHRVRAGGRGQMNGDRAG
jgi:2-polyprenyl-6-methoxyphenol hydroxylase-like FAD-dependent oxidoreductase